MFTAREVNSALKDAELMGANKKEKLQNWYYFVSPNPQKFHVFRSSDGEHVLQVGRVVPMVLVSQLESDSEIRARVVHYDKKENITEFITDYFLNPEKGFESIRNFECLDGAFQFYC